MSNRDRNKLISIANLYMLRINTEHMHRWKTNVLTQASSQVHKFLNRQWLFGILFENFCIENAFGSCVVHVHTFLSSSSAFSWLFHFDDFSFLILAEETTQNIYMMWCDVHGILTWPFQVLCLSVCTCSISVPLYSSDPLSPITCEPLTKWYE